MDIFPHTGDLERPMEHPAGRVSVARNPPASMLLTDVSVRVSWGKAGNPKSMVKTQGGCSQQEDRPGADGKGWVISKNC